MTSAIDDHVKGDGRSLPEGREKDEIWRDGATIAMAEGERSEASTACTSDDERDSTTKDDGDDDTWLVACDGARDTMSGDSGGD
jgi:hypothetical protein